MKKLCVLMAILLLFTLAAGCKEKSADPTKPATDPTKVANGSDSTETTGASQTEKPDNATTEEPVVKVQDSENIMSMHGVVSGNSSDEYWSGNFTKKAIAEYANAYTPFVSKIENGVLNGVTEISFEPDCKYDIVRCKVSIAALVDDSNPDVESRGVGHKAKAKFDGRKVTVDFGWWHESDNWTKTYTDWSYGICVKDKGGNFYNYYFRVNYGTTDPVGLFTEEDYESFISRQVWYNRAIGCVFATPEEIPAEYYFYSGVNYYEPSTEEEIAYFKEIYPDRKYPPNIRMPVKKMNEALSILGVTVDDIKLPSYWHYFDKADSYYFTRTDAYDFGRWSVEKVEHGEDGIVKIYLKITNTHGYFLSESVVMILTIQKQDDGTYQILSNLPQDDLELPCDGAVARFFYKNIPNEPA